MRYEPALEPDDSPLLEPIPFVVTVYTIAKEVIVVDAFTEAEAIKRAKAESQVPAMDGLGIIVDYDYDVIN